MIKLTLQHPLQPTPLRTWTFEEELTIAIGRSTDNDVVVYSSVISRYHVQLKCTNGNWEIINLGKNGTYLNGRAIANAPVVDGMEIDLGGSGLKIVINIDSEQPQIKYGKNRVRSWEGKKDSREKENEENKDSDKEEKTENMTMRQE
ncbi:MAG: FHA domain-containing protein [Cyanobacteriota bacterium]|nr:FHA domain-containing protein [Cyanobacteriota bacterium]